MPSLRYFKNKYADYSGNLGDVSYVRNLIPKVLSDIEKHSSPQRHQNKDGGLYVGSVGIAYAFYHVAESGLFPESRQSLLSKALEYLQMAQEYVARIPPQSKGGIGAAFLLGHAGVYAVSILIYHTLGIEKERDKYLRRFLEMSEICKPLNFFPYGSDELFIGRAGYLCAALNINTKLKAQVVPNDVTQAIFNGIVASGKLYAARYVTNAMMFAYYDTEYLGAAHGLSSILQMLLSFPQHFQGNQDIESTIINSANLMLHQEQNSNYPPNLGGSQDPTYEIVEWCHGAAGVVYLMVKAYLTWKDDKFLQAAVRCGEKVWEKGLLRKGPGICHGVAGNGYVFLLLYRLTQDKKYLYRAYKFADFMQTEEFQRGARTPDHPFSLYEGLAGTVCFYTDLLQPDKAAFPFFDVFT